MSIETTTPYTVVIQTADGLTELASAQVIIGPALLKRLRRTSGLPPALSPHGGRRTPDLATRGSARGAGLSSGTAVKTWTHSSPRT